ncbi:CheR family methyltransferase [Vagococcus sp.]|uniref:CheR family methyltransferase n=1 Tax=Vagococcus sp. TaxID=1933889 RepID=UPI003F98707C
MEIEFIEFYNWIEQNLGIDLFSYKEKQLQRRILTIMKNTSASNLKEYCQLIKQDKMIRLEFLDYITINVTEFFRNPELFFEFEDFIMNELKTQFKTLKIWSAACSIGCEPYSIAMIVDKRKMKLHHKIIATDIDQKILEKAKQGEFKKAYLKNVSEKDLKSYFKKKEADYTISESIKNKVFFKKHDLLRDKFEKECHVIVCRNVTIYFKNDARDKIYRQFSESLVTGGILFTGATETINNPEELGLKKISTFIYQKQG